MMDDYIHTLLRKEYKRPVIRVGAETNEIPVTRKRNDETQRRMGGMLPFRKSEKWEENLTDWVNRKVEHKSKASKKISSATIAVCYDTVERVVYWKYIRQANN